jgi:hypothetical protein
VGTTPILANGVATSNITITLRDAQNNAIVGTTPTFSATGTNNIYSACSATNAAGVADCTLASTTAEVKTLSLLTPVNVTGNNITFTPGPASPLTSDITGTTPVIANGVATSAIIVTLRDVFGNPLMGTTPTFGATGTNNIYGACSATNAAGQANCTLASTTAEVKTLSIQTPIVDVGSNVTFISLTPSAANSSIVGTTPVLANGVAASAITVTLRDASNNPVPGVTPTFSATGTNNTYGACSVTDAAGVSNCSLSSTTAEVKSVSIATPVVVLGNNLTFTAGAPSAATSNITGTTPVIADGVATSIVTITLLDAFSNPISGTVPTFSATGSNNIYGACSATNASGVATCSLASTRAQVKQLSIQTPIVDPGSNVTFTAGASSAANSSIVGTTPVLANGVATSAITITLRDAFNNPIAGLTPTFNATGSNNNYGACSATNPAGVSSCTLASITAEVKTISMTAPVAVLGNNVTFTVGAASPVTSDITGTTPVVADGVATSLITITLRDAFGNAISGVVPTFAATGFNNIYGACSATNGSGISNCTLASTRSQVKTLSIQTPIVDVGGDVTFVPGPPSAATSIIWGTTPVPANGVATSLITVALRDVFSNPISGVTPTFAATGSNNIYTACSATDILGNANCTLASTTAEVKTVSLTAPLSLVGNNVTFTVGAPSSVTSDITGTTPVLANGAATSIITITLRDAFGNAISGITPTFAATGSNNIYGACSATNSSGQSNCTLASTTAQVKTLSIQTPIVDVGGNVTFVAGTPVAGNSNIVGTSPVLANGVATSGITITLRDAFNNPVVGTVPTFAATGTNNIYGACSATDPSGTSNCTLASTTAQVKTLSIQTPIFDIGGNVTFFLPNAAPVLAFESATTNMQHISGNGAVATPDVWRIPESLAGTIQLLGTDPEGYDFVAPGDFTCNASSAGGIPAWFSLTYDSPNNRIQINIAAGNSVAADKTFFIDCVVRDGVPQPSNTYFIQLTVRNNVGPIIIQPVLNLTVDEDVPLFYNLATNVSDPDTPVLNYKIFDTNNPVNPPSSDGNDTLFGEVGVMGQNGQFMYVAYKYNDINRLPNRVTTPGNPDHFTYQVDDGINPPVSGVVNITINPVNDPPVIEQLNGPHNIYDAGMVSVGGSIDVNFNVDEGIGNGAFDWSINDYDDNEDSQTVVFSFASNNPSVVNPAQISVINFPDSPSVDARSLNPHLHIVAGGSQGVATITMTADDQQGGVTKQLLTVRVSNFVEPDVYDYCNFVFNGPPTYPPDQPPNGNGSPEKPWLVYNASQFNQLRFCGRDNHTFLLKGPIDLSGYANWIPIGSPFDTSSVGYTDQYGTTGQIRAVTRFEGEIYGDYRPITGLNINRPTTDFVGLFGIFKGKAVTIEVRDGFVVGRDHVGMFAGSITDGELRNMFITNSAPGPVTVQGHDYVGGIAGYSRARGLIADSSVSVSGASIVGGLFGALENQAIENITVSGQVVGTGSARYDFVGGVVGLSINGAMIQYAHATGRVTGNGSGVGGVVGASVESGYFHALESNATVTQTLPAAWGVGGIVGIYLGGEFSDPRAVPATAADVVTGFNAVGGVVGYHGGSSIERGIAAIPTSTSAPATAILVSGFGNTKRSSTPNCCDTGRSYWDTSINSYSQAGVPKTHAELQDPSVGSYDSSWPFFPTSIGQHAIWYKPANATSYPQLTPIPGVLAMSANIIPNSAGQILNIDGVGFDIDPAYTESVRFGMSQPGTDNCIVQSVTTLSPLVKRIQCLMPIFYADPSGPPPVPVGINVEVRNRTYTDPIGSFHSGLSGYNAEYTTGYPASANPSVPAWQPFPQGINAMSLFITYP